MASAWDDLWQRSDQQAAKALDAADYAKASELATDTSRRGSAEYKRGNYQLALDNFARASGTDADYNRGNALAKLGQYQDAIAAYDKSLKQNPGGEDARANKAAVEALLKQQQQAQQQVSNSPRDASQKDQNQSNGGGHNSSPSKAHDQSSKEGKSGQPNASSGQGQQPANAKKPDGGSQNGEQSRESGKNNEFAEAAKKLAGQRAGAKADESQSSNGTPGGNAADQSQATANAKQRPQGGSADSAQPLDSEERMAAEQWLRRIPDDPGGLLRRKFLYQYRQRAQHADADG
jgi:Ca-activated chloride channel family protein